MERKTVLERKTRETSISLEINLDGSGSGEIDTGVGFFDHMLELFARHGGFDLSVKASGDLRVDAHHTVEDIGIVLGRAFADALGEKRGIRRYGVAYTPMDESLSRVTVDLSGRPFLHFDVVFPSSKTGDFDLELVEEFMRAFAGESKTTLHISLLYGLNSHHIAESIFKGLGRTLKEAATVTDPGGAVPSSKGVLS